MAAAAGEDPDMDEFRKRLEHDLRLTVSRLRQIAGPDELEDLPASIGSIFDDADSIQVEQAREMGLMTKARLVQRANAIAAALRRLETGAYGVCVECSDTIKPARLLAMPEVQTCVPCQEEIEGIRRFPVRYDLRKAA
ncbi:MAG: TraR/DksA family transcriptional regulator [Candidatus Rokuibacteriota bacterium]